MCVQTVLSGNGDIFQPSLETCFWFGFGGISSRVETTVIKKAATEGELYCFLDVCVLWCYKRERNQREISTAPLKQFLLHKHLKGHFAKKPLFQNTRHIRGKKSQQDIEFWFFFLHDKQLPKALQASVLNRAVGFLLPLPAACSAPQVPPARKATPDRKRSWIRPAERQVSLWPLKADRCVTRSKGLTGFFGHVNLFNIPI